MLKMAIEITALIALLLVAPWILLTFWSYGDWVMTFF